MNIKNLQDLEKQYEKCKLCKELAENRTNIVFGTGNPDTCKVVIIGEAPGATEDIKKTPFVGRSGQLLDSLLEEISIKRPNDVYITNTVLCKPPKNRDPTKIELTNCRERLNKHIELLNPKVIVPLGNFATKYILETKEGITKLHGKIFEKKIGNKTMKILPMVHPAVLVYNGNSAKKRAEFQKDFEVLRKILKTKKKKPKEKQEKLKL